MYSKTILITVVLSLAIVGSARHLLLPTDVSDGVLTAYQMSRVWGQCDCDGTEEETDTCAEGTPCEDDLGCQNQGQSGYGCVANKWVGNDSPRDRCTANTPLTGTCNHTYGTQDCWTLYKCVDTTIREHGICDTCHYEGGEQCQGVDGSGCTYCSTGTQLNPVQEKDAPYEGCL
jgi:hypothetical protein